MQPPVLFATWLLEIVRIIFGPDRDALRPTVAQRESDIGFERGVATFMLGDRYVVHPNARVIVHGAEVQEDPAAVTQQFRVEIDLALVPDGMVETLIADAAARAFRRIRHLDRVRPVLHVAWHATFHLVVECEAPRSVERDPVVSSQLRPRIRQVLHGFRRELLNG
jgi:hypothetical protein